MVGASANKWRYKMNICINCGKEAVEQHHVIPLSLGGNDIPSTKVWLCNECHNKIHNRSLGMGQLAANSSNFRKAVAEGRVGRPSKHILSEDDKVIFKLFLANKLNASQAIKLMSVSRVTFYKYKDEWSKNLENNT